MANRHMADDFSDPPSGTERGVIPVIIGKISQKVTEIPALFLHKP
jgi:hypothetical protein